MDLELQVRMGLVAAVHLESNHLPTNPDEGLAAVAEACHLLQVVETIPLSVHSDCCGLNVDVMVNCFCLAEESRQRRT